MSITLNLSVEEVDSEVLKWYSNSDPSLISEALWYGWKTITYNQTNNLQTNKKIDELKKDIDRLKRENQNTVIEKNKIEREYSNLNNTFSKTIHTLVDCGVEEKTKYMDLRISELNSKIESLEELNSQKSVELQEIREIFNNSKKKGNYAEEQINEYLEKELKNDYLIYQPGLEGQKHQGDTHILVKEENLNKDSPYIGSSRIMIESKFYKNKHKYNVSYELEKFYEDIDYCQKKKMPIHCAIFISLDCSIHDKTESYCYEEYQGVRIHFIANMTRDKWILLKSLIEIETYMYKELIVNKDKTEKIYNIMYEGFNNIYTNYTNLYNIEPKFEKIIDFIRIQQKDYQKSKRKINNSVEMLVNRLKNMINGFKLTNIKHSELETKLLEKNDPNDISKNELLVFQELLMNRLLEKEKLESELLDLQQKIEQKEIKKEENKNKKTELKCPHCSKTYSKKRYYDDHVAKCNKSNNEQVKNI